MNILFTCAGRRHYLLGYFKRIKDVRVIACDASIYAPALYLAHEYFIIPDVYDLNYISILLDEAKARNIDAIIPLNDLELPVLAENKRKFEVEGIRVIVPNREIVDICFDKYATIAFSKNLSVTSIPTFLNPADAINYKKKDPDCSFIIKPRWGSASLGIEYPMDEEELVYLFNSGKRKLKSSILGEISSTDFENSILIQKRLTGKEYGLDIINDLGAKYVTTLIRQKISMRSGETDKAETIIDNRLSSIGEEIGTKLKHIGILDCDIIVSDDKIYLLELNPRFGGGYPFMHFAGANLPLAIVEWLRGKEPPAGCLDYKNNLLSAKVDIIVGLYNC